MFKNKERQHTSLDYKIIWSIILLTFGLIGSSISLAQEKPANDYKNRPLDVRVDRLERLTSSQKQLEVLYRVKQLQQENQQLRSLIEEQSHTIRQLREQQKSLYNDLNRRLSLIETNTPEQSIEMPVTVTSKPAQTEQKLPAQQAEPGSKTPAETDEPAETDSVAYIKKLSEKERKQAQIAYQQAYDELIARRYYKARELFVGFIKHYPNSRYAHIAQYWVAESSYAQKQYKQAIKDYQRLLNVYPYSPKKAEAQLKKANSYNFLGDTESARKTLKQLLLDYPKTTEAAQAQRLLKQL